MGSQRTTIKNLKIVKVDPKRNEVLVTGSVPGKPGGLLVIRKLSSKEND
jgi:large subunit ribosomal protein L3